MPDNDTAKILEDAERQGGWTVVRTYLRFSGPGWLQSALTLGGGSLASALFLGVVGGYSMLWVQAGAMIMGVIMLAAIAYVSLSIQESPFEGMRRRINPVLAWGWILATLAANMVWSLPQFSLAYGALTENIAPGLFANADSMAWKLGVSFVVLAIVLGVTLLYDSKGIGIKIYESILKIVVGVIVVSFIGVAIKLAFSDEGLPLGEIFAGFIPNPSLVFKPSAGYQDVLNTIGAGDTRAFWHDLVLGRQRDVIVAAASAAVGINMTFLLPFSMRAKGWGKSHRGVALFDLSTGMVIPFLIATSCIVIASGYLFHGKPYEGVLVETEGRLAISEDPQFSAQASEMRQVISQRQSAAPLEDGELKLAAMLLQRSNAQFATSLETLVGPGFAHFVFGIGVLGMALSSISLLMLISGFVVCELFGYRHGGIQHKLGTLLASTGVLWPLLWTGSSRAYLAIPTSVIGYTLLPVAFMAFFLMMNSRELLGENRPRGRSRVVWNTLMGLSLAITGTASVFTAGSLSMSIGGAVIPIGKIFLIGFGFAIIAGHFYLRNKSKRDRGISI